MNTTLDQTLVIQKLISSNCDVPLAAERLSTILGERVNEYQIIEAIASDPTAAKQLSQQLRVMTMIRLFGVLSNVQTEVESNLDSVRPSDLVKMYTSLMSTLTTMTQPDTKVVFDFDSEAEKAAIEFGISKEEALKEVKQIMATGKAR